MRRTHLPLTLGAQSRGFSLMELMLAIALLAIVGGIATPIYQGYRERVRENQAATDIKVMGAELQRFQLDRRNLPATLDDAGLGGRLDPWGRPYVYYNVEANGRGGARKDKRLNPLNTDFDLYSLGKNGVSKPQISQKDSVDDIIRASNGRFVGEAADY